MKDKIRCTEWEREESNEADLRENMWLSIQCKEGTLALGTVYMGIGKHTEWNDRIEQTLVEDIQQHQTEGAKVLLLGDFNGHIGEQEGGVQGTLHETDENGRRVIRIMQGNNLVMLNGSDKCSGKWTRMRGGQKPSIIDYALVEEHNREMVHQMEIDDSGKGLADSTDHSWIELQIKMESSTEENEKGPVGKPRWRINDKTDWGAFRERLEAEIDRWNEELDRIGEEGEDAEIAYRALVDVIESVGLETMGRIRTGSGPKRKKNRRLRRAIKRRNMSGRSWRRAQKGKLPSENRLGSKRSIKYTG